jgi:hypothetical protein
VSRGARPQAGAYQPNIEASPAVDREYLLALEFLTNLAKDAGLNVE